MSAVGYAGGFFADVELFNWMNGERCNLPNYPVAQSGPAGGFFENYPLICGGKQGAGQTLCYKYVHSSLTWTPLVN